MAVLLKSVLCMHQLFVHFYVYSIDRVKHWLKEEIAFFPQNLAQSSIDRTIFIEELSSSSIAR